MAEEAVTTTDESVAAVHAASLLEWIAFYGDKHNEQQLQQPTQSSDRIRRELHAQHIVHALEMLLQRALPLLFAGAQQQQQSDNEWTTILCVLEQFYETPLDVDASQLPPIESSDSIDATSSSTTPAALAQLLALALGTAVQCDANATFVRDILTMRGAVQADLKVVIESVLAAYSSANEPDDDAVSDAASVPRSDAATASPLTQCETVREDDALLTTSPAAAATPLHVSRNAALERLRRENEFLRDESTRVASALEAVTTKTQHLEADNRALVDAVQQLELQREVDVLRKERTVRAMYDDRISALERDLCAATAQLHDVARVTSDANALRDEVDVLRPIANRATKAEAAVATYKRKLEDLAGVRETLRRVEAANAELTATTLSLEAQLATAATLQRKLSDAKAANTAIEFRVSELEALLRRRDYELERIGTELDASQTALREATALIAQLQTALDANALAPHALVSIDTTDHALTHGVSEFNPELMQRLARLEHDNATLRSQVDSATAACVDELRDAVADAMRLKQSFETRYFSTERDRVAAVAQCEALTQRVTDSAAREAAMTSQLNQCRADNDALLEQRAALNEDVQSHEIERSSAHQTIAQLELQCCDLTRTLETRDAETKALEASLRAATVRSEQLTRTLAARDVRIDALETAIASHTVELAVLSALFGGAFEAKEQLATALQQCSDAAQATQRNLEMRLQDAQRAHSDSLAHMTDAVTAKATELQQLRNSIHERERDYAAATAALRAEHAAEQAMLRDAMAAYQQQHSVSDAERAAAFSTLQASADACEVMLKATIASQLDANRQLSGRNRALKLELQRRVAAIAALETAAARLESKVLLLERERAHVASQDERKRESERDDASAAAQLSTQLALVVAELEALQRAHSAVQTQVRACRSCSRDESDSSVACGGAAGRVTATGSAAASKSYYVDRIRALEQLKQQDEHKRRELLLVNSKLVQEQRQLQSRASALGRELAELREQMNRVLLRDERRRNESDKLRERLATLETMTRLPTNAADAASTTESPCLKRQDMLLLPDRAASIAGTAGQSPTRRDTVNDVSTQAGASHDENTAPNGRVSRKRKVDSRDVQTCDRSRDTEANENLQLHETHAVATAVDAARSDATRVGAKRRMPRFLSTADVQSDARSGSSEKPSECQQQ